MKKLILIPVLLLAACSTTQQAAFKAFATASAPIVEAGIVAAGGAYGPLAANLYGMAVQAWANQPVAQGSAVPAIASAVVPVLPAPQTGPNVAALLTAAAATAQAKAP